jgi:peptide chain release factor 2
MGEATFWDNPDNARKVIDQLKPLNGLIKPYEELSALGNDLRTLGELIADDPTLESEWENELSRAEKGLGEFELKAMLSGSHDASNAYLRIQAGAGGTDACDWAEMLVRMYIRWAERQGFNAEIDDEVRNPEAGIHSCTLHITGDYAYGFLQGELGVHRLVRLSPFGSGDSRQTSFAAVDVLPEIDDSIDIVIKPDDLEKETFCTGGPGGQHQNKTQSGVRLRHLPSGITAESRVQRSQHKNYDNALKLLKARLYQIELQKRMSAVEKHYDAKGEVSFGSQTRNYILHPYNLVKDVKVDVETTQAQQVLDGDLEIFIQAYLRRKTEIEHKSEK